MKDCENCFFGTITIYMNNCRHELWWWPLKLHHLDKFLLLDFWLGWVCLLGHDEGWWKSPELKYYVTSRLYWASYCLFEIFYLPFKNKVEKCQMEPKWFLKILFKPLKLFTILCLAWAFLFFWYLTLPFRIRSKYFYKDYAILKSLKAWISSYGFLDMC